MKTIKYVSIIHNMNKMDIESPPSYAWRGPRGAGKRTALLQFLKEHSNKFNIHFELKHGTWFLNKSSTMSTTAVNNAVASANAISSTESSTKIVDDDIDDDTDAGKSIPFEESAIHLGFDVARMSMSDKVFLQNILQRWSGQQDVCLVNTNLTMRFLVLYHAHLLADESVLQLQECLEQYPNFVILLTTELPICHRLRDFCLEIPVSGSDSLLHNFINTTNTPYTKDVWATFFENTLEDWSKSWKADRIAEIRNWIYICLQRNLRWSDAIQYWIDTIHRTEWITADIRKSLMEVLWKAESSGGWTLITSYRIPILWEHIHYHFAKRAYCLRNNCTTVD